MTAVISYINPRPPHPVITLGRSRIYPYSDGSFIRDPEDDALPALTLVVNDDLASLPHELDPEVHPIICRHFYSIDPDVLGVWRKSMPVTLSSTREEAA